MRVPFVEKVCLLILTALLVYDGPTFAQTGPSSRHAWDVGASAQAVFMERAPTGSGVQISVSWHRSSSWGLRFSVRRDAAVQRDIDEAYATSAQWSDQRRTSVTPAVLWRPMTAEQQRFGQFLEVHVGPTVQVQRGERMRFLGTVHDGLTVDRVLNDSGYPGDNAYLDQNRTTPLLLLTDDTNRLNVGATTGLRYGLTYNAVTVYGALSARTLTNVDGVTVGIGGGVSVSL